MFSKIRRDRGIPLYFWWKNKVFNNIILTTLKVANRDRIHCIMSMLSFLQKSSDFVIT